MTENTTKKQKRVKPDLPGGFRDYGPADAIARQAMIDTIRKTFESFGFDPLETSSVQRTEVLTGGEEDSGKIIFNVKGSQEEESDLPAGSASVATSAKEAASAKEGSSLRFDLTVPLARFMAANPDIPKPFKRYQIGNVWRGERPQAGRYREFMQADVDIVGFSAIDADAEIATIIYTTLKNLGIENFIIKINSRKILNAVPELTGLSPDQLWGALRILDKQNKIGGAGVIKEFEKTFGKETAKNIEFFLKDTREGGEAMVMLSKNKTAEEGSYDLLKLRSVLKISGVGQKVRFEPSMVRGLSYYTGTIFEAVLTDLPEIGSIFSGGRYDNLVSQFTGQTIPAVGASLGIDRLFAAMEKLGTLQKKQTLTQVLILQLDVDLKNDYLAMAQELRTAGINTALYLGDDQTFQAQLAYAVKKEIPYVIIYGEKEKAEGVVAIKNLVTREQKEILRDQLAAYFPPEADPPLADKE